MTPDGLPAEEPDLVIAHLSDTHLTSAGVHYHGVIDAHARLAEVTAALRSAVSGGRQIDALVVSGDLTDSGDPVAYRSLQAELISLAPQVIYATGNHDVRAAFHRELLGRPDVTGQLLQVHRLTGLRLVVLDSTVVGAGHGVLEQQQIDALRAELATPSRGGTVVVLHHAPLPPPSPLLRYFALERASRRALSEALAGSDTRLILAGHHHLAGSGMLGAIPVAVAPSTAIRTDPLAPAGHERTFAGGGFNLVSIYPDTFTVSVIPVDGAEQVFDLDADGCAEVIAAYPVPVASQTFPDDH